MARYIDAEKAKEVLYIYFGITSKRAACGVNILIDDIPTADVAPVRHGHWKYLREEKCAFCTACKTKMHPNLYGYGFCPLCGARMDGKENEK